MTRAEVEVEWTRQASENSSSTGCERVNGPGSMTLSTALPSGLGRSSTGIGGLSPAPVDSALGRSGELPNTSSMSLVDGCPECVLNSEPPKSVVDLTNARRAAYLCSDCGHAWTTDWSAE